MLSLELQNAGHIVEIENEGLRGFELALEKDYDLILLDMDLSQIDSLEMAGRLQEEKSSYIMMMMSHDSTLDVVQVLDGGADAYISKPFAMDELMAHVRAMFRRQTKVAKSFQTEPKIAAHDLVLNKQNRSVRRGDTEIALTKREYDLLNILMANMGHAMSREALLENVWQYDLEAKTNVVDVYVRYLRGKIDIPGKDSFIQTVRGVGYIIRDN